jgi:hypothetical protein
MPKVFGLPEERTKSYRHGWSDGSLSENDFVDGAGSHADARAMAFWEMLMGFKYSSGRISPGVIFISVTYSVTGVREW